MDHGADESEIRIRSIEGLNETFGRPHSASGFTGIPGGSSGGRSTPLGPHAAGFEIPAYVLKEVHASQLRMLLAPSSQLDPSSRARPATAGAVCVSDPTDRHVASAKEHLKELVRLRGRLSERTFGTPTPEPIVLQEGGQRSVTPEVLLGRVTALEENCVATSAHTEVLTQAAEHLILLMQLALGESSPTNSGRSQQHWSGAGGSAIGSEVDLHRYDFREDSEADEEVSRVNRAAVAGVAPVADAVRPTALKLRRPSSMAASELEERPSSARTISRSSRCPETPPPRKHVPATPSEASLAELPQVSARQSGTDRYQATRRKAGSRAVLPWAQTRAVTDAHGSGGLSDNRKARATRAATAADGWGSGPAVARPDSVPEEEHATAAGAQQAVPPPVRRNIDRPALPAVPPEGHQGLAPAPPPTGHHGLARPGFPSSSRRSDEGPELDDFLPAPVAPQPRAPTPDARPRRRPVGRSVSHKGPAKQPPECEGPGRNMASFESNAHGHVVNPLDWGPIATATVPAEGRSTAQPPGTPPRVSPEPLWDDATHGGPQDRQPSWEFSSRHRGTPPLNTIHSGVLGSGPEVVLRGHVGQAHASSNRSVSEASRGRTVSSEAGLGLEHIDDLLDDAQECAPVSDVDVNGTAESSPSSMGSSMVSTEASSLSTAPSISDWHQQAVFDLSEWVDLGQDFEQAMVTSMYMDQCRSRSLRPNSGVRAALAGVDGSAGRYNFAHCCMGDAGLVPLLFALGARRSLRKVSLRDCKLTNQVAPLIAVFLRGLPALEELDLSQNRFSYRSGKSLLAGLRFDEPVCPRPRLNLSETPLAYAHPGASNASAPCGHTNVKFSAGRYSFLQRRLKKAGVSFVCATSEVRPVVPSRASVAGHTLAARH
mmetsp:Transcript_80637/g.184776  ORF Transcript_80637/g.184776 Transcript_80637/m.184776 type:complete len:885 (-) Transcript_80637:147-2801(-)